MKKTFVSLILLYCLHGISFASGVRTDDPELVKRFSDLTNRWFLISYDMNTYEGLKKYCSDENFRANVMDILDQIHDYDSMLYKKVAQKAMVEGSNHEIKKTLKQIEEFETKYNADNFYKKLREECHAQRQLEKSYKETKNDIGENSYDSQVIVLEADLKKYVRNISRLMDHIKEHIHHLHVE